MIMKYLWNLSSKKRRRFERVKTATKITTGVGIATAVGIAAGILFAPKSGRATRGELKTKALSSIDNMKECVVRKSDLVDEYAARASNQASYAMNVVHGKLEDVKNYIDKYFCESK